MKRLFNKLEKILADAALFEGGVAVVSSPVARKGPFAEFLEENFVEIAYAEAADYENMHEAILRERQLPRRVVQPDDCQDGDNDLCFIQS